MQPFQCFLRLSGLRERKTKNILDKNPGVYVLEDLGCSLSPSPFFRLLFLFLFFVLEGEVPPRIAQLFFFGGGWLVLALGF